MEEKIIRMENLKGKIEQLLNKAEWTDKEKQWLLRYLENTDAAELRGVMEQQFEYEKNHPEQVDLEISKKMLQNIHERTGIVKRINKASIVKMQIRKIAAASVIGFFVLSIGLWLKRDTKKEIAEVHINDRPFANKPAASGSKAVLTLADGSAIVLDDAQNGILTQQGKTKVFKLDGKLAYKPTNAVSNEILYNTISVPRGEQYQVKLPDGSQVWLNAASSLHFPTAFVGKERRVEVTGEAYFEVVPLTPKGGQGKAPFIVKINTPSGNAGQVEVLGTHFNINSYSDEASLKTTLLEGEVKFVYGSFNSILKPGQQSQLKKNGQVKVVSGVDVAEVVAWKNGIFDFKGAGIESVARQLSRWYDVEIVYDKKIDDLFYAKIPRSTKLTDVLKLLELTGKVHFEINGRRIIVKP